MESVVARAGWWLVALCFAIFMFANAVDTGFAIHMAIFGLAALAGLVISLTKTNYFAVAKGIRIGGDESKYDDDLIRAGVILTTFWGVVGFLVGLVIASQLAFPLLNLGLEWTSFGRLRPLHTSAVIFAFGGTALISTSFYIVQRTCRTRLAFPGLAKFVFWGYQLFIIIAATGYVLGITQGKEYAEPEWYADLWLTIVWVAYLAVFVGTLMKR
ncbi:MAG: cytochrome-c oxidase, cbb3-type subunit, partial [Pseudomonadota bacterium]